MGRHTNPAGYVYYDSEDELKQELEQYFFPYFFDKTWKPIDEITKEVYIGGESRIDYFGYTNDRPAYAEVKNWWVTNKDIEQILRYCDLIEKKYPCWGKFYLICGGIEEYRLRQLYEKDRFSNIRLIRDIKEINPEEVAYWM